MKKLLVANRGEIALRIIRTARRLGLATVAVYSDPDAGSPHVRAADESIALGGTAAVDSYLRIDKILHAAKTSGADAVHPGYGFLAENADFARAAAGAGIAFVGPPADVLLAIGNKDSARKLARAAGVPVPEGYDGEDQSESALAAAAERIGFPLLIKAVAGGGGRGMRLVGDKATLAESLRSAEREAAAFFGDGRLILEQYLKPARHIEVQLIGDSTGTICHLFERDCSLQRRYQKLIEESPARNLDKDVRSALLEAAVRIGQAAKLSGAATAEFLVPEKSHESAFFFLEVNPRIQVEHPVTEMVTGFDLVELQLRVAAGEKLSFAQKDVSITGHAIEARVCSEIPAEDFRPSGGRVEHLELPIESDVLRLDHALATGLMIGADYDSLILKVIAHGKNAAEATKRLGAALEEIVIGGPETNVAFLSKILESGMYGKGRTPDTSYLDSNLESLAGVGGEEKVRTLAERAVDAHIGRMFFGGAADDFSAPSERRLSAPPFRLSVESRTLGKKWAFEAHLLELCGGDNFSVRYTLDGTERFAGRPANPGYRSGRDAWMSSSTQYIDRCTFRVEPVRSWDSSESDGSGTGAVVAPLPGTVIAVHAVQGGSLKSGDPLAVIESMKMEHVLRAAKDSIVSEVRVEQGAKVKEGEVLFVVVAKSGDS